jgi:hypothetical protein
VPFKFNEARSSKIGQSYPNNRHVSCLRLYTGVFFSSGSGLGTKRSGKSVGACGRPEKSTSLNHTSSGPGSGTERSGKSVGACGRPEKSTGLNHTSSGSGSGSGIIKCSRFPYSKVTSRALTLASSSCNPRTSRRRCRIFSGLCIPGDVRQR